MLTQVKVSQIKPNPYRHFATYEIQKDKVEALKESISASGFWGETVIARPRGKHYELAFGHHRWQAVKEMYGSDKVVEISVRELDNDNMLKMMARENNEIYDANASQDIELVKAAIEAHAKGEIHLPEPKTKGNGVIAKGLRAGDYISNCQLTDDYSFTRESLHEYLALDMWRIKEALGHLRQMREGLTKPKQYDGMSPTQAQEMKSQVNRAKSKFGTETAKEVAKEIASAAKSKDAISGRGSGSSVKKTFKEIADSVIGRAQGKSDNPMPSIDEVVRAIREEYGSLFSPQKKTTQKLNEVIENQQYAEQSELYGLKQLLRGIARKADDFADKIDAPEESLRDARIPLEVVK